MAEEKTLEGGFNTILSRIDANALAIAALVDELRDTNPEAAKRVAIALENAANNDETTIADRPTAFRRLARIITEGQ